jgi:catechol 2,3-dioxygenase-like lactoylglutathione lyase family enzyme
MPEFKKAYVTIMVEDLDRSVDFYANVLALVESLRFGDNWAEMVTQGITIGLHPKKADSSPELAAKMGWGALGGHEPNASSGTKAAPHSHGLSIGFEVKDIRATAKELEAKGVKFHFQENDVNILAFFKDPDGTPLYLTQVR